MLSTRIERLPQIAAAPRNVSLSYWKAINAQSKSPMVPGLRVVPSGSPSGLWPVS